MNLVTSDTKSSTLYYLFGKVWHYSQGNQKNVVLYWILFIVAMVFSLVASPFIMARMLDIASTEGVTDGNIWKLWKMLSLAGLVDLLFWLFHGPARLIEQSNALIVKSSYSKYLTEGVLTLPLEWHAGHQSGDTIDKIKKGTEALSHFAANSFLLIYSFVQFIVSFIVLSYFCGMSGAIIIIMVALSIYITIRFDDHLMPLYEEVNLLENGISASITDAVTNITTIVILRVERLVFGTLSIKIDSPLEAVRKNNLICEIKWFLTSSCCTLMVIFVLGFYFWQHKNAPIVKAGELSLLYQYLRTMCELFFKFTGMYGEVMQEKSRVINSEILARDFKAEKLTNHILPPTWKHLAIEGLSFSYQGVETKEVGQHIDSISLSLEHGETVAFVGETGSGKTTALKLMRDLYHPETLRLYVDGIIVDEGFAGISRAIALVPQDPELFAKSIRDNITMGAEHPPEFVQGFTEMACFDSVIGRLPRGLDSSIQEKGVNLSGGEQQRLALARGLLACYDKDVVLLDEPTSALDTATEMKVYQNIFQGFRGKTIVSTIHRLHLLPLFDRIIMFEKGRIVGTGSVDELRHSCPSFALLFDTASSLIEKMHS